MELSLNTQILIGTFLIAAILGAVVNKTNFCTMGAVSDWVNIGDKGRLRAWFLALTVALIGVLAIESMAWVGFDGTRPPYRSANFAWARYLLGGALFGVGMTLASGCGNKNLVRIGGGNLKSIFVVVIAGVFAYLMTKTDFYGIVFHSWINPISIDLSRMGLGGQDLGSLFAGATGGDAGSIRLIVGGLISVVVLVFVFKSRDFRRSRDNILSGLVVGLAVIAAWYLTGGPIGQEAIEEVEWLDAKPDGVGVQSFTFINPMGETLAYLVEPRNLLLITFGVAALSGVIVGSFIYAVLTGNFRVEWFASIADFVRHLIGAVLMGIGGVLGMGCTIGQGVTGTSTLALGSFLTLFSIIIGSATTMKVEYYRMLYEEASFGDALVTGLVDLHLLPKGLRKLEAL